MYKTLHYIRYGNLLRGSCPALVAIPLGSCLIKHARSIYSIVLAAVR